MEPRDLLRALFDAAVDAAQPDVCVPPHLPPPPSGRTIVLGAGKASAAMAGAVEAGWSGRLEGLVVTRYGHGEPCAVIEVVEAAHPVPDAAGEAAAKRILALAEGAGADDLVLFLASGGGSALLTLPAPGLTLGDKQAVNERLLASGATISEINCVRKHLSVIKGGRLAVAAHPAPVIALAISDVPRDDPAVIASGPTVPDPTTFDNALALLGRYGIDGPPAVIDHLRAGTEETPKAGDPRMAGGELRIVARPAASLDAAAKVARAAGFDVTLLGDSIEGEARDVARQQAKQARAMAPGSVLLSGGEVTVTLTGGGRGGPNAEFALALGKELDGAAGIWAMACDTDGIDGSEDNAGAVIAPDTLARARARGLDASSFLADNDAYGFFAALGDLIITGPTRTNVNDFRAIVVTSS